MLGTFQVSFQSNQSIIGTLTRSTTIAWDIAVVYANNDMYGRRQLWEDISNHLSAALPHVVGGDFNCILEPGEKKGGKPFTYSQSASEMGDFMAANDFVDPGFSGPAFTWTNNKDARSRILSRLDRFLVSSSILDNYQEMRVVHLTRVASDHCPILCSFKVGGRKAYSNWIKFEDVWTTYPRAWQIVLEKWKVPDSGSEATKLQRKCRRSLRALFFWSRNKMDRMNQLKEDLYGEIRILQEIEPGLLRFKLRPCDIRRRGNVIEQLNHPNGQPVTEQTEILHIIHGFFAQKWRGNTIIESDWPSLNAQAACMDRVTDLLEGDITREEVWNAVRSLGPNRAPGRDGISASFFKAFWDIVGEQVNLACLEFFSTGCMDQSWKETVIVLLPKIKSPNHPSNFRLISLCQTIYKIVAKILVNRIKGILPCLISEEQAAFMHGRSISNHCMLGQEIMNKFKISTAAKGWMAMKVDMEQAYDKMSWRTLELVILRMGFPLKFRSWVLSCVTAPRFTISVNGMMSDVIVAECGFRQGCPLSPYLFILCSELLSLHFKQNYGDLGVPIREGGPLVSHLLYADDVLFFAGATIPNVKKFLTILDDYCCWTGQRINSNKSAILFSKLVHSTSKHRLARLAGCRKVEEMDYLGVKLAMRRLTKADFGPLLLKLHNYTLSWGTR
ncbi:hypothetical protein KFK09_001758 [Dendrobium nobile]|uniref:Reverse transcriptase domain-containing protein n=1 Tax=Dendrobium nobile TaxID=94219 RepID=A0A8T3CB72_DENNO|nr:hypothetical protein KFK09_001758 [Dendrobium nobile]